MSRAHNLPTVVSQLIPTTGSWPSPRDDCSGFFITAQNQALSNTWKLF